MMKLETVSSRTSLKRNGQILQGLFALFTHIGSGDPVRVLRPFHNEYTGYN